MNCAVLINCDLKSKIESNKAAIGQKRALDVRA